MRAVPVLAAFQLLSAVRDANAYLLRVVQNTHVRFMTVDSAHVSGRCLILSALEQSLGHLVFFNDVDVGSPTRQSVTVDCVQQCL